MNTTKILIIVITAISFISCSDEIDFIDNNEFDGIILTRAGDTSGSWEDWSTVKLVNLSTSVSVPWNPQIVMTAIPDDIRFDIKAEDGWELLIDAISYQQPKLNYLIFYNNFTGILKGFYYLETAAEGNNAFWQISFEDTTQKLFYNQDGYFTYPMSLNKTIPDVSIMNVTTNYTKGFTEGWNCFQLELTYSPATNPGLILGINAYQQNISTIEMDGEYESTSSGKIIGSAGGAGSSALGTFQKSTLTTVGDSAATWIINNISKGNDNRPIKNMAIDVAEDIAKYGVSSAITSGLALAFSSIFGGPSKSSPSNYTMEFKTTGKINLVGKTESLKTTSIPPLKVSIGSKSLGVWNMKKPPVMDIHKYAIPKNVRYVSYDYIVGEYEINKHVELSLDDIMINPELTGRIKNYGVNLRFTSGYMANEIYNTTSSSRQAVVRKCENLTLQLYGYHGDPHYMATLIYDDGNAQIWSNAWRGYYPGLEYTSKSVILESVFLPNHEVFSANGAPAIDLEQVGLQTEDIKVVFVFEVDINGKTKRFEFMRTYDPDIKFTNRLNWSVGRYTNWTPEKVYNYFKK